MRPRLRPLGIVLLAGLGLCLLWLAPGEQGEPAAQQLPSRTSRVEEVPPSAARLEGHPEPGAGSPAPSSTPEPAPASVKPERLVLAQGRVIDGTGRPVAGVAVSLYHERVHLRCESETRLGRGPWNRRVKTDDEGVFRFRQYRDNDSLPRTVTLTATQGNLVGMAYQIRTREPPFTTPDLLLSPALPLRGEIVDSTGAPLVGAVCEIVATATDPQADPSFIYIVIHGKANRQGEMVLPSLPYREDWSLRLTVQLPDYPEHRTRLDLRGLLTGQPFRAVVPVGLTVVGRALDASGQPAAGRKVGVAIRVDRANGSHYLDYQTPQEALTDADGQFEIRGVPPTGAVLTINAGRGHQMPHLIRGIEGADGARLDLGTIHLQQTTALRGVVVDDHNQPRANVEVIARMPGSAGTVVRTKTNEGGRFVLGNLPPNNEYDVETYCTLGPGDELRATRLGIRPDDGEITVRLGCGGTLLLRFHAAAAPDKRLRVRDPGISWGEQWGYMLEGAKYEQMRVHLPGGRWTYVFRAEGYRPVEITDVVRTPDQEVVRDLYLEPE